MKAVFLNVAVRPVFMVMEDGRPVRAFAPPEQWVMFHSDLEGLKARVEAFEAQATAELEAESERFPEIGQEKPETDCGSGEGG